MSSNFYFDVIRHFTLYVHFLDDIHEQHMGFVLTFFCSAKFSSYFSLLLLQVCTLVCVWKMVSSITWLSLASREKVSILMNWCKLFANEAYTSKKFKLFDFIIIVVNVHYSILFSYNIDARNGSSGTIILQCIRSLIVG